MATAASNSYHGPGLLYVVAAIVVVAVAGARFLGFGPGSGVESPPAPGGGMSVPDAIHSPGGVVPQPDVMTEALVYHTHTSENYQPKAPYEADGPGDVVTVGMALVEALREEGVQSVHVMTVHDLPRWNQAVGNARASVEKELARHDGVRMLIDIHRDAVPEGNGEGYAKVEVGGESVARILLVVGSADNPLASENVRHATALQEHLERLAPGITRGVRLLDHETTGDLHPNTVTAYVGDYRDNTVEEAKRAARYLGLAIAAFLSETG